MTQRRFHLYRDVDVSGISGTGKVAEGVEWSDGTVALRWLGDSPSSVHWDNLALVEKTHGHDGLTRVVWMDMRLQPSIHPLQGCLLCGHIMGEHSWIQTVEGGYFTCPTFEDSFEEGA